jgi:hypothetical protein
MVLNGVILPEAGPKILTNAAHVLVTLINLAATSDTLVVTEMMATETSNSAPSNMDTIKTHAVKPVLTSLTLPFSTMVGAHVTTSIVEMRTLIHKLMTAIVIMVM